MKGVDPTAGIDAMDCEEEHHLPSPPSLSAVGNKQGQSLSASAAFSSNSNSNSNSNYHHQNTNTMIAKNLHNNVSLPLSLPPPPPHAPIVEHRSRSPASQTLSDNHFLSNRIIYKA